MLEQQKNYYEVLGVDKNATVEEIKKAYRSLAKLHHPDVNQDNADSENKFKEINEANETLSDPEKRKHYDQFGTAAPRAQAPQQGAYPGIDPFNMFGFGAQQQRNSNIDKLIQLSSDEAQNTTRKTVNYQRHIYCSDCNGKGSPDPHTKTTCPSCGGDGRNKQQTQRGNFTQIIVLGPCPHCYGRGVQYSTTCATCSGFGLKTIDASVTVDIPVGSIGGTAAVNGGGNQEDMRFPAGDLLLQILLEANPKYKFAHNGAVITILKINPVEAMLGTTIKVEAIDHTEIECELPVGCEPNYQLLHEKKGLPFNKNGDRGPFVVQIEYEVPKSYTEAQKKTLNNYLKTINVK